MIEKLILNILALISLVNYTLNLINGTKDDKGATKYEELKVIIQVIIFKIDHSIPKLFCYPYSTLNLIQVSKDRI